MLGSFIYLRLRAISLHYYRQFGVIECMIEERWRRRPRTRLRNCTILRSLAKNRQPGSRGLASCSLSAFYWSADCRRSDSLRVLVAKDTVEYRYDYHIDVTKLSGEIPERSYAIYTSAKARSRRYFV